MLAVVSIGATEAPVTVKHKIHLGKNKVGL